MVTTKTHEFRYVPDAFLAPVIVTAVPFVFGLAMLLVDFAAVRREPVEHLSLLAVFVLPFVACVAVALRRKALAGRIARGEVRLGLFLEPERLVWALPGAAPVEVARSAITGISTVQRVYGKGRKGPDTVVVASTSG